MSVYLPRFCTSRFRDIAWEFCSFTMKEKTKRPPVAVQSDASALTRPIDIQTALTIPSLMRFVPRQQ
jgi:hypothetical protein